MPPERLPLTPEGVAQAEQRIGIPHPVVTFLDRHLADITRVHDEYDKQFPDKETKIEERQKFLREKYGFLADAIVAEVPDFSFSAEDMIAVWSRAVEVFPDRYQRYALARIVTGAYAVSGVQNDEWKKLPRYYLEHMDVEFPESLPLDEAILAHVETKLIEIGASHEDIGAYIFVPEEEQDLLDLHYRVRDGDEQAKEELADLVTRQGDRRTLAVGEAYENLTHAYNFLSYMVGFELGRFRTDDAPPPEIQ